MTPPPRWRALLGRVLPPGERDVLLPEVDALYGRILAEEGRRAAVRRFRREVLHLVVWSIGYRLRERWGGVRMDVDAVTRQARFAARRLTRAPGFTAVAVLTLALGIAASSLIVGLVDRALLRPLPYPDADRLVAVLDGWGTSKGSFEILQREMTTLEVLGGAVNATGMTLERDGRPAERVSVAIVSPEYLRAVGVTPVTGRLFQPEESEPGRGRVVLVSREYWRAALGEDPQIVGASLVLDGESHQVVGILPPGFDLPSARNDLWRPVTMDASEPGLHWGAGNHTLIGRMATHATPEQVRAEILGLQDRVRLANPLWTPNAGFWDDARVTPLRESRARGIRTVLLLLLGSVGVVLLVVCANVANLFLSRGLASARDAAVRAALGAGQARLAREQMMEVAMVAALGLASGLALAWIGLDLIRPFLPADLPGADQLGLDLRVVGLTSGLALVMALLAGVLPALRAGRTAPGAVLRASSPGAGGGGAGGRTTRWLVAAQLCAAVVLVTSAGLLARTVLELGRVDPGFASAGRVTAEVYLAPGTTEDPDGRAAYLEGVVDRLNAHPELRAVALGSSIPFGGEDEYVATVVDGVTLDPNDLPVMPQHRVTPAFFDVAGIPLVSGRGFTRQDRVGTPAVAIVDETFVRRFFPDGEAVGRTVRYPWRGAPPIEIVGVVGATAHADLASPPEPTVWFPLAQMGLGLVQNATVLAVGADGREETALAAVHSVLREADPRLAVSDLVRWDELLGASLAEPRLLALILSIFAGATLLLGCVGVYGVAAYAVRSRMRDIGVRLAVGAPVSRIRRRVLRDGLLLALPGGALGLVLAVPAARALQGVLYGVTPLDPVSFLLTPVILTGAALLALVLPARRATRVDPISILRAD